MGTNIIICAYNMYLCSLERIIKLMNSIRIGEAYKINSMFRWEIMFVIMWLILILILLLKIRNTILVSNNFFYFFKSYQFFKNGGCVKYLVPEALHKNMAWFFFP